MAITTIPVDPLNPTNAEIFSAISEISSDLEDLKTEALGSWAWDKGTGIMTMFDTYGAEKFKFEVSDDAEDAKRERRTDLES